MVTKLDWSLLLAVVVLLLFSVAAVYSASASLAEFKFGAYDLFLKNHIRNLIVTFITVVVVTFINYQFWKKFANIILTISIFFLILVLFFGVDTKGAARWLDFGWFNFQPSELAKFAIVLYIAKILDERKEIKDDFWFVPFPIFFNLFLIILLIAVQPNFSSSFIIFLIVIGLLVIANIKFKYLATFSLLTALISIVYAVSAEYRLNRLLAFFNESTLNEITNTNYQSIQSLVALGNGGLFGLGPGGSRQSLLFLPEAYSDFIFAIIGEEYGFIGLSIFTLLFVFVLFRVYLICKNAPDFFSFFISSGFLLTLSIYFFINALVNLGLLPTTGVPMPFISYGGSAMLTYGLIIGVLLNISININLKKS
ncbi:MAG: FtsW/RodA/SpoVE family cell cycle protein [Ignavibacteria bacterium]|nr:FtsW/RodA/SpoVE family cell cycle protein [Ignavibacteria bacterium]